MRDLAADLLTQVGGLIARPRTPPRGVPPESGTERAKKLFDDTGKLLAQAHTGGAAGAVTWSSLWGLAAGFGIGVVTHVAGTLLSRRGDPLCYLRHIERAGVVLAISLPTPALTDGVLRTPDEGADRVAQTSRHSIRPESCLEERTTQWLLPRAGGNNALDA